MTTGELLADQARRTREWTLMVLAGFEGNDWTYQPQPGLQHALWLCGHLACAQETLIFQRCLGKSVLDPAFRAHFGIGGPIESADEHDWPSPALVRSKMDDMQKLTEEAIAGMSEDLLAQPAYAKDGGEHPHYDTKLGAVSHLVRHEAFHAGQLAMIRRLLGKPFLR